jgi:hypothetical protein
MVFPSLFFQNDPGIISQASGFAVFFFSMFLHRFKMWGSLLVILLTVLMIYLGALHA